MKFCRVKNLFSLFGKAFFSFLNLCCWDTRYSILLKKKKKKKKSNLFTCRNKNEQRFKIWLEGNLFRLKKKGS